MTDTVLHSAGWVFTKGPNENCMGVYWGEPMRFDQFPMRLYGCAGQGKIQQLLLAAVLFSTFSASWAQGEERKADTSRVARKEAIASMPLANLAPQDRAAVEDVINDPSIYRRLPSQVIDCDPHFYLFLLDNPDIIVQIWRVLGISNVELDRTGDNSFRGADGEGTTCDVHVLHRSHDRQLLYATGAYEGSVLKNRVEVRCVMMLRSKYIRETNGRHYVTCALDVFVRIDQGGLELLAKTFQSLIGRSADMNFAEAMGFVSSLSRTAEVNPDGVARISRRLNNVHEETKVRLAVVSAEVAARAEQNEAAQQAQHQEVIRREPVPRVPRR